MTESPSRRTLRSVLREVLDLLCESFAPTAGRFLPFDNYPSSFRPPMKKTAHRAVR